MVAFSRSIIIFIFKDVDVYPCHTIEMSSYSVPYLSNLTRTRSITSRTGGLCRKPLTLPLTVPSVVDLEQRHDPCGCLAKFKGAYDEIWVGQKLSYPCPFVFLDAVSGQTPALPSCSPSNSFGFASRCGLLLPLQSRNLCLTALDVACRLRFVCTYLLVCLLGF